ncbi:hypothetical protein NKI48_29650 [Mesorhizobium sp. M0644]|uniref:hypothetical protein n=1 Tax=Mesorhizobium sp. M0644 TaxID=2956979 RepID=UPI00333DF3CF
MVVEEPDIMVAFLSEKNLPEPGSVEKLRDIVQDLGAFDLSNIMRDLQGHIVNLARARTTTGLWRSSLVFRDPSGASSKLGWSSPLRPARRERLVDHSGSDSRGLTARSWSPVWTLIGQ